MIIRIEHLGVPPQEYNAAYFANFIRALEAAIRRADWVPVYGGTPGPGALYSDGSVKIDSTFNPIDAFDIIPKSYSDAADAVLRKRIDAINVDTTQIHLNTAKIAANLKKIEKNTDGIADNLVKIEANEATVAAITIRVLDIELAITDTNTKVAANELAITDTNTKVAANELAITDTNTKVAANELAITDLAARLAVLEAAP